MEVSKKMDSVVRKDVEWPFCKTTIVVANDRLISIASFERMFDTTRQTLKKKLAYPHELYRPKKKVYDKVSSGYLHLFVTRAGLEKYMRSHMNWKDETIQKAMRMVFDKEEDEEEMSSSAEEYASPKVSISKTPLKKRERSIEAKMDSFLDEMRAIVHQRAQFEYQQSPQFKEDCAALVNQRVDEMMPEIREQLRRELEPEVREQLAKKMREDEVLCSLQKGGNEEIVVIPPLPSSDEYAPPPEDFIPATDWRSYRIAQ